MVREIAAIFDVEGTLVDSVQWQLESWRLTLASAGYAFSHAELQPFSGMDGRWMLDQLVPAESPANKDKLLEAQGELYQNEFLHRAEPFPGVRELFETLKTQHFRIGIGTTCQRQQLERYEERLRVLDLTEAVACGELVKNGKPDPALFQMCLARLNFKEPRFAVAIGDTPYDTRAAKQLGMRSVGVLTGGFSAAVLREAGCDNVISQVREVENILPRRGIEVISKDAGAINDIARKFESNG